MKIKLNQIVLRLVCLCLLAGATALHAADGAWAVDADGNWSTATNWNASVIADGSGSTASFINTITAGRTVTSDTARTIGNLVFTGSGALNWTLTNSAALTLATGSGTSTIAVNSNTATFNASGAGLAGAQTVLKNGVGILSLAWNNTYSGGTVIGQGRVNVNTVNSGQFGTGAVTITNNSILMLIRGDTTDSSSVIGSFTNQVIIPVGQTGTIWNQPRGSISGTLTGGGILNLQVNATRGDMSGNWSAFTGQINVTSRTGTSDFRHQNVNGYTSGKVNLAAGVNLYYVPNPPNNTVGIDFPIGELSGAAGSTIQCGTALGRYVNYTVGGLNTSSTFGGNFAITGANGYSRLVKNGTGAFTLTGNNTFYSPLPAAVAVNAGKLVLATSGSISNSAITVAAGATNSILLASAGGQTTETNVMFRPSAVLELNFSTVAPSATVAPLQVLGTLGVTNTVTLAVVGGVWTPGSYPLVKYFGTLGGDGFGALVLGAQPLRVSGVLSNDTVNSRIWYVVSAVNNPVKWAVGNANWDIATSSNWKDAANVATTYQEQVGLGDQTLFDDTASGSSPITVTLNTGVTPASVTFSNVAKNYILAGTSNILGSVGLTKIGAGTLTIQNTNSFTGVVSLNGGTVNFNNLNNNFGGGTAITFAGGTLQFASGNTADISARTVTINAGGATLDTAGNNVAFASRIGNSGAGGLTKAGAGTLTLNTNSTYTGNTVVSNGVLALGANTSLSNSAAVIVSTGTTVDASATGFGFSLNGTGGQMLAGNGAVSGAVTTAGGAKLSPATNGVIGTLTFNNDLNLNGGTFNLDVNNGSRDLIVVSGNLNLNATVSGTVQINALALLTLNSTNKIFQYPVGQLTGGGVSTLSLAVSGVAQSGRLLTLDNSVDGEIDLVVHAAPANNLTWQGGLNGNTWDLITANWLGAGGIYSDGDNANFTDLGAANSPVTISATVTPNSVTFNATNPYTLTGAKITGSATVTKSNTNTVILANVANDYGMTVINNGVLQIGDGSATGTSIGQGAVTDNASLVFNQPDNSSVLGDIGGTGSLSKQGAGTLTLLGSSTYSGPTTVDTGVLAIGNGGAGGTLAAAAVTLSTGGTLDLNHSGTYTLANTISGNGILKFDGAATVTYGSGKSYLQNTYINNGVVKLSAANVIPSGGSTTGWLILDGGASAAGALDLNGFNQSVNALSGLGGTVQGRIYNNGSGLNTLTLGTIASTTYAGLIMNNNGGSGSIALTVTGDGSLANSLTLSGANSFTGPVYIDGGSVIMGGAIATIGQQSIGTGAITLTNNGSLQMNGYGSATQSGNFVNNVLVPAGTTGNLKTVGRGNYSGNITVHGTLNLTTSYVRSIAVGDWSASDGQINILAGTLGGDVQLNNAGNINWGTAAVDLGAGVAVYNTANTGVAGNTFTIGELTGTGSISDTSAGTAGRVTTYVVGGRNSNATFAGTIFNRTRITAINKVGTGSWTLNGTDTYTGATTVSGGSLIVGPSSFMAASTPITVNSGTVFDVSSYNGLSLSAGQTLAGSGVVTGLVTAVTGTILSPGVGTAAGTLSFSNNLTLTGDFVTNNFNLSSDPTGISLANSKIIVLGDLNVTGANVVTINPLNNILGAGSYTLFKYNGTLMTNGVAAGAGALGNNFTAGGAFAANAHVSLTFSNTANNEVVMIVTPNGNGLVWSGGVFGTATNNWDLNVSTNWVSGVVVTNFLTYDSVTFNDTATNFNAVVAGTLAPGAVTVNSTNAFTFSGTGKISGSTGITKNGTNVLTIGNTGGNDYTGAVTINNGTVKAGSATALGATNGATVISGTGALDIGGQNLGAEPVTVSGSGLGGAGAIQNSGAAALNALQYVTLAGNATFGGTNRWDIRANTNGTLAGNGFALTKTSTNDIYLVGLGNTALGNLQIQSGRIGVQDNTLLGASGTLTLLPGSGFDFFNNSVTNTKAISMTNATVSSTSGTNVYGGTINLNGAGTFTATTPLQFNGALGGTGGLVKNGASSLTLTAANTYSGSTTISNGSLALVGTASVASSPAIEIAAGAVLDVSGHTGASITLASSQTLRGNGTVSGSVNAPAGSTVSPGVGGTGTLTITNILTLGGTTLMEVNHDVVPARDQIVATNIIFGGTLTVVNTGSALTLGDFFKLFVGANSGSFATITLPALDPGLAWTNTIALNGTISVVAGPSVNTGSTNITSVVNGGNLELIWPADHIGWYLQAQTNTLADGLGTNWVTISGTETVNHFTNTINPAKGSVFYRMMYP